MNNGLSDRSVELRRHLLSHNGPDVVRRMAASGFNDPVGLIIEMTDDTGKQLTYAALEKQTMPKHELPPNSSLPTARTRFQRSKSWSTSK